MISLKRLNLMKPLIFAASSTVKCPQESQVALVLGNRKNYHQQHSRSRAAAERDLLAQRRRDCRTLNLPEECNDESQVRDAYIKLAKKYHPDGGTAEASAEKFHQIDTAYKNLLKSFADFRHNRHKVEGEYGLYYEAKKNDVDFEEEKEEEESPDIKHTAPQHRQYLSFDGVGSGTPFQREKQYNKYRRAKAAENVMEYRVQKISRSSGEEVWALAKEARASKKIKTGIGIERLVEDLIQESMAKGEFDNLSGKGKPLSDTSSYNPYIDFTTHKLNQVLMENGFAPEWILLEREIKDEMRRLRKELSILRHKYDAKLTPSEDLEWKKTVEEFRDDCDRLNKNILKFNLTVPSLHKQLVNFLLDREAEKALNTFSPEMQKEYENKANLHSQSKMQGSQTSKPSGSFMDFLFSAFKT